MAIPKRFFVAVMLFLCTLSGYMARVNFSVNLIPMVQQTDKNKTEELPDYGPRYAWSQTDQSLLLGGYFYSYLFTNIPGGLLAERYGGKIVALVSMTTTVVFTALCPLAASINMWLLFVLRLCCGLVGGVIYPCCQNLISRWSPPNEKGKFVASLMGGTFGTVITWPIVGFVIEKMGWDWGFYIVAISGTLISLTWWIVVADSPAQHSTITEEEREYIEKSLGDTINTKKRVMPFGKLCTSAPFWALLVLHLGNDWGLFFTITSTPKFLSEVLGFDVAAAGFLSSVPHLTRMTMAFILASIFDLLRRKEFLSVTNLRKLFSVSSHVFPGLFLILLAIVGKDPYVCILIMSLSLGCNGAASVTNLANPQDLAPNFAGTLYGVINTAGATPGFYSPLIVAAFTYEHNTLAEWRYIFLIGASAYIIPAIIYFLFGSGEVQPWNDEGDEPEKKD